MTATELSPAADRTRGRARQRPRRHNAHRLTRLLHSWLSMVSLLVVLFFAVTGLTLNHQDWTFGQQPTTNTVTGQLPAGSTNGTEPNFLAISEYLRSSQDVSGQITDYGVDGDAGRLSYQGPGYAADVRFSVSAGSYNLTTTRYGLVAFANELHQGRHTSEAWSVVIDASAILLAAIALTGLVLQLLIQRRRRTALVLLGAGVLITVVLVGLSG